MRADLVQQHAERLSFVDVPGNQKRPVVSRINEAPCIRRNTPLVLGVGGNQRINAAVDLNAANVGEDLTEFRADAVYGGRVGCATTRQINVFVDARKNLRLKRIKLSFDVFDGGGDRTLAFFDFRASFLERGFDLNLLRFEFLFCRSLRFGWRSYFRLGNTCAHLFGKLVGFLLLALAHTDITLRYAPRFLER